ncbi:MAG: iron complex outermembrane receptor protein [Arenicella sp.]|jgi:iron complex outermembrane receptor protein
MRKCYLLLIAILLYAPSFAQKGTGGRGKGGKREMPSIGRLVGEIVDEAGKPVEYATVALMHLRDSSLTGAITDAKGKFEITEIKLGRHELKVSFIGYETYVQNPIALSPRAEAGIDQNLGSIAIKPSAAMIEAVEVSAERDIMEMSLDKKVFNVDKNITATGGSATDVLQNVPSVSVDIDGNVSLRGSENVNILIDGKPSGLTGASRQAILEQIPAATIERIEVITNPSAKYDADGTAGIINIVTKKNGVKGLNGSVTVNVGTRDKYNATGLLNYRKGKWNHSFNYSYRYDPRFREGTNFRENLFLSELGTVDSATFLNQVTDGNQNRTSHLFKFGTDYSIDNKNTLSMSVLYNQNSRGRDELINYEFLDGSRATTQLNTRNTEENSDRESVDFNLGYSKDFNKKGQNLSVEMRYSDTWGSQLGEFVEQYRDGNNNSLPDTTDLVQRNLADNSSNITTIQIDYVNPVSKTKKYEFGYKSILRNILNDFQFEDFDESTQNYIPSALLNNEFDYSEDVHAAYVNYSQGFGKLSLQAGLRAEQTFTQSDLVTTGETFENDYFSLFPSGYLSYNPTDKDEWRIGYSRRVNRPRTRQLNPFRNNSDLQNVREGNPFLLPEYIDSYEVSYARNWDKISLTSTAYWREIHDMIRSFRTVLDDQSILRSYVNLSGGRSYGLEMVMSGKVTKWWNLTLSTNVFQSEIDGSNIEADLNNDAFTYSFRMNSNIDLPKDIKLQISTFYRAPFVTTQGEIQAFYSTSLALQRKILKGKGTVNVRLSDVFNNLRFKFDQEGTFLDEGTGFTQSSYRKRESRIGYLSFSYRFGKATSKKRRKGGRKGGGGNDSGDMDMD